jgi:hypothetical protein
MKYTYSILLALLLITHSYAQQRIGKKELDLLKDNNTAAKLMADTDEDFKNAGATTQWGTESAVILAQKTTFDFDKKGISVGKRIGRNFLGALFAIPSLGTSILLANNSETKILVQENERRKILLRDKFAVDQYSILYFRLSADGDAFAARVIKKDGAETVVDMSEAVRVESISSVPSLFTSYTDQKVSATYRPVFYKVAVPDIEEGDIIEYEFVNYNTQRYLSNPDYKEFEPVYYLCNRDLPVVKQVLEVVTEDDRYYVSYKSLKGAPDFVQSNSNGNKVYRWTDNNRENISRVRYVNKLIELPSIKFQVVYARNNSKSLVWFKDDTDTKKNITLEELAEKARTFWFQPGKLQGTGDYSAGLKGSFADTKSFLYKAMRKKGITNSSDDEFIQKAYYTIRAQTLYNKWSDFAFAKIFSSLLAERKIAHEIIVTTTNYQSTVEAASFAQELNWLVRCNNKYYANPYEHGNPEELPLGINGNPSVRFNALEEKGKVITEPLPVADTTFNSIIAKINVSLTSNPNGPLLQIDKTVEAQGLCKESAMDEVLALTPFMENDFRNYDGTSMWEGLNAKEEEKAMGDFNQQKKEWKEEKPKMMKSLAEDYYGYTIPDYGAFKLIQDGRSFKKRNLKYNETFTLDDAVNTVGDDWLVSLPSLAGGWQVKLKKEEQTRSLPIDLQYARTIQYTITCAIPEGYTARGVESLNKTTRNEVGSFTVKAAVENNKVVIDVKKIFNSKELAAQKWPELQELLNTVYSFSKSKILFTKK